MLNDQKGILRKKLILPGLIIFFAVWISIIALDKVDVAEHNYEVAKKKASGSYAK